MKNEQNNQCLFLEYAGVLLMTEYLCYSVKNATNNESD